MGRIAPKLVENAGFDVLEMTLARDVRASIQRGLSSGAVFQKGTRPLQIFRAALSQAVRDIEAHPRGRLIQRLLRDGPYEDVGEIPRELDGKRLTDEETAAAVAFIHRHLVNCFQGALAELLAIAPCVQLMRSQVELGQLPRSAKLFVADLVRTPRPADGRLAKAADLHILAVEPGGSHAAVTLLGVVEVKSFSRSPKKVVSQIGRHVERARQGLWVRGRTYPADRVRLGPSGSGSVLRVEVRSDRWKLPRGFRFVDTADRSHFVPEAPVLPRSQDAMEQVGPGHWRITLRWSNEALAAAAYDLSFWYMEQVGAVLFASDEDRPWPEMSPREAGANAAKQALYYAILRARSVTEAGSAVALYNTYGFGYAIGMNFRKGRTREMLWPEQLREIAASGRCSDGSRIVRSRQEAPGIGANP